MTEQFAIAPLAPIDAVKFFRAKGFVPEGRNFDWRDVWKEEHARAFTVAKALDIDVLTDIRTAVDKALSMGQTLAQFKQELAPLLQARGWWGIKEQVDPLTGELKKVRLGSARRLQIIYDTNMRMAHAAGRWEGIQRVKKDFPYLMYDAVNDSRTRPQHRAWDGLILRVEDPFWNTHFPPNGWRCRCTVLQLDDLDVAEKGLTVSPSPEVDTRPWYNDRTMSNEQVPVGIDPGFDYNVGKAHLAANGMDKPIKDLLATKLERTPIDLARQIIAKEVHSLPEWLDSDEPKPFLPVAVVPEYMLKAIGGKSAILRLSDETLKGHLEKHPDIDVAMYAMVQKIIDQAEVVIREKPTKLGIYFTIDGLLYKAVIKTTTDKSEIYLCSIYQCTDKKMSHRLERGDRVNKE